MSRVQSPNVQQRRADLVATERFLREKQALDAVTALGLAAELQELDQLVARQVEARLDHYVRVRDNRPASRTVVRAR